MPGSAIKTEGCHDRASLNPLIVLFCALQASDLLSTVLVFSYGGAELNPVVRSLMPWMGRLGAVMASKAALVLIIWTFARNRKRVLYFANILYVAIVMWNLSILVALK